METTTSARDLIAAEIDRLGLTVAAEFVPFSQSRNKDEKYPSLNWRVTVKRDGRDLLTTDYMAGSGHCPVNKLLGQRKIKSTSLAGDAAIRAECETGKRQRFLFGSGQSDSFSATRDKIEPDAVDVISALARDADVLDAGGFEDWASNFGYDTDSRKAEAVYRACLEIALRLRGGIGEDGLKALQTAAQDY